MSGGDAAEHNPAIAHRSSVLHAAPELAVVIPTLNERDNIIPLLERLDLALNGIAWEAIFVDDDSPDGTADRIRELMRARPNLRVLQRVGRRGLTSACMEGMMATAAPFIAVMDADLQHDESLLPRLLAAIKEQSADLAVGSRKVGEGSMGALSGFRATLSDAGRWLSRFISRSELQDPMSGFFLADRRFVQEVIRRMSGVSYKVLVDMLASSKRPVRLIELPYVFRGRLHGASKLDVNTAWEYGVLITHKLIRGIVPVRFVLFSIVGLVGVVIHLGVLGLLVLRRDMEFMPAHAIATGVAMISNFWLNNIFTFRERRLKGSRLLLGAVSFFAACAIGGVASVATGVWIVGLQVPWYAAGALGTIVAAVWNFGVTSVFTWPERRA